RSDRLDPVPACAFLSGPHITVIQDDREQAWLKPRVQVPPSPALDRYGGDRCVATIAERAAQAQRKWRQKWHDYWHSGPSGECRRQPVTQPFQGLVQRR